MPSLSDPNPLTCVEAVWAGLPLLVSNHVGNYPEIVEIGKNGFVFDYSNTDIIFNILDTINKLEDEWYQNAKKISYFKAQNNYKVKKLVTNIINELISVEYKC